MNHFKTRLNNEDGKNIIYCPWCRKHVLSPKTDKNVILVYNCSRCAKPLILFNTKAYKMDEDLVKVDNIDEIEEYVFSFLEEQGIDFFENGDKITEEEVEDMRYFLKHYRIPREGDFFDGMARF